MIMKIPAQSLMNTLYRGYITENTAEEDMITSVIPAGNPYIGLLGPVETAILPRKARKSRFVIEVTARG